MEAGLKEFKDLVKFVVALGNGLGETFEDGKFSITEVLNFLPAARLSKDAIEGIEKIPQEVWESDEAEINELREYFINELDIPQDNIESVIESGWTAAINLVGIIRAILGK